MPPQMPTDLEIDRKDHVWIERQGKRPRFKCVLCGAVTDKPPDSPTPQNWNPQWYEKLTPQDRTACPGGSDV